MSEEELSVSVGKQLSVASKDKRASSLRMKTLSVSEVNE